MPGDSDHPVTLGDLLTIGVDRIRRPATVADLVSALRAEGVLVVEKVDGEWPEWPTNNPWVSPQILDRLAEAQPFPPAGGVS